MHLPAALIVSPLPTRSEHIVAANENPFHVGLTWATISDISEQGIFLSPLEEQSSLLFNFVFKMFSIGSASLPEGGMGEVPKQIAADLPEGTGCRTHSCNRG